jgi:hypothetical protein
MIMRTLSIKKLNIPSSGYDKDTQSKPALFTTQSVRAEEEKLIRFADRIAKRSATALSSSSIETELENKNLSEEQKSAYVFL